MSDFKGKVVLITGTARGCGQVLAEAFAGAGARVVACDRDAEAGERVAERIRAASGEIDFSHADVSVEGEGGGARRGGDRSPRAARRRSQQRR